MTNRPQSTPKESERFEQIVSYLDGELSAEESARVEQRLATDEAFRRELQSLDRAWAALEELPLTTVEDRFAKTTMEMVVQNARGEVDQKTRALPIQKRNRTLRNGLLVATAAVLGCLVFRISWQNPNRSLLADLDVIQNADVYAQFREVDFLRQLSRRVPSDAWPADADSRLEEESPAGSPEQWLEDLAKDERLALRAKTNRFRALPAERQEQLRRIHNEINTAKDAEQLQQTMRAYQQWLGSLPASEQYELRELSADRRVGRIQKMLRQHATSKLLELSPEELRSFFQKVKSRLEQERGRLLEKMAPRERARFQTKSAHEQRQDLIRKLMRDSWQRGDRSNGFVQELIPEGKRQAFEKLSHEEKRRRLARWMAEALMQEGGHRSRPGRHFGKEISEQDLEKHFAEELDAATLERLLALPRDKMQRQLQRKVRGDMRPGDWNDFFDRDRGPPRPSEGRRRLHDRPGDHPRGRPPGRPPPSPYRFE
ncbi:MAG: hypothetical protein GXP28_08860 [Planctomycetes bacterium]|nr:hypothetical protein [Planctomycetota bacterium]